MANPQTAATNGKTHNPAKVEGVLRNLTAARVKLSDMPVGFTWQGVFKGRSKGQPFTRITDGGEIISKQLVSLVFEDQGKRTAYLADMGILTQLDEALVTEGMKIRCVKGEKKPIGKKDREMNSYEIFEIA